VYMQKYTRIFGDDYQGSSYFGRKMYISDDYAIIGDRRGYGNVSDSGFALVFKRNSSGTWEYVSKLVASDGEGSDLFGESVAISGNYIIVGAPWNDDYASASGSAYIFKWNGSSWSQTDKLTPSDTIGSDYFGWSVSIYGDYAVAGCPSYNGTHSGYVYVFRRSGESWNQVAKKTSSDAANGDRFGWSVSMDNGYFIAGAKGDDDNGSGSGSAYIFQGSGSTWTQRAKLKPSDGAADDNFGDYVQMSGEYVIISAPYDDNTNGVDSGCAYIFQGSSSSWTQRSKLVPTESVAADKFGYNMVSLSGDYAMGGTYTSDFNGENSGAAYIFERSGLSWNQTQQLIPFVDAPGVLFGGYLAISDDTSLVRGRNPYAVYVIPHNGSPRICCYSDQTIQEDSSGASLTFNMDDYETDVDSLIVTVVSSDESIISNSNITITGTGISRTLSFTPTADEFGNVTITITVDDGTLISSTAIAITVTAENDPPALLSIDNQMTNEDIAIIAIPITATDDETAVCSLGITFASSDTTLVPVENISYTCSAGAYYLSITPANNQSGNANITITITDAGNLTATQSFSLTVNAVNDAPFLSTITDQTTLEDIATSIISFTATDIETAASSLILTMTSSDQTLVPDEYLLYESNAGQYSIVATPALNQYGTATISVTITDGGGLAASTSFNLTVIDVDDNQYMWANFQAAESVLGQTDFISGSIGTLAATSLNYPSNVAVDPTTGKVFVCDGSNNRILRFSAADSLLNGSAAEAVLGQANFVSNSVNRGSGVNINTFSNPTSAYVDSFGRLWVADVANHRVLRFDHASTKADGADADAVLGQSNFTSAIAGTTQNTLRNPGCVWVDTFGSLWVSDSSNHRILRFDNPELKANGANADAVLGQINFTTGTAGTTQSKFNQPLIIRGDNNGTLFVSDTNNNRVLRFDNAALKSNGANADGVLGQSIFTSSTARTTADGMNNPRSVAVDHAGHLYVAENGNRRIIIYKDAVNKADGASADYVLGQPDFTSNTQNNGGISERSLKNVHYIFFDNQANHLWIPDYSNYRVLRFSMMTKTLPVMSPISDATMDEDTISNAISLTVTDINEQALTITYISSDTSIISSTGITFSGDQVSSDGSTYTVTSTSVDTTVTLTITPESNQSGTANITITVTDPDGMTATQSFALTVTSVNDTPVISTISDLNTNEDTAIN
ncbi:hypothetical protein MHK_000701, partial [Candidatus Magnetomorum sp. HK-1]